MTILVDKRTVDLAIAISRAIGKNDLRFALHVAKMLSSHARTLRAMLDEKGLG